MISRSLTLNGITFDPDAIQIASTEGHPGTVARFHDPESGALVLTLKAFHRDSEIACNAADLPLVGCLVRPPVNPEDPTARLLALLPFAFLKPDGSSLHKPPQDWAPLLDLAVESGLQLPESIPPEH